MKHILAILAAIAVMLGVSAAPAEAVSGSIYFYNNTNGTSLLEQDAASIRTQSVCYTLSSGANNLTGYIKNTSAYYWYVYDTNNCSGFGGTIYPNSQGPMNSDWNNKITSYYRATGGNFAPSSGPGLVGENPMSSNQASYAGSYHRTS